MKSTAVPYWAMVVISVALICLSLVLWKGPDYLLAGTVRGHADLSTKDYATLLDDYRKTLAQLIGGLGLVATLFLTWQSYLQTVRAKITDRFSKAAELLGALDKEGNPAWEPRMCGVYALADIAKESPDEHHQVVYEILSAYLRHHAHLARNGKPDYAPGQFIPSNFVDAKVYDRKEVQAILTVFGRRSVKVEKSVFPFDLSHLDLREADLNNADLRRLDLDGSYLDGANMSGVKLDKSTLHGTSLRGADAAGASFGDCVLKGADLFNTNLRGADLSETTNLEVRQLQFALGNRSTKLPPDMPMPENWSRL